MNLSENAEFQYQLRSVVFRKIIKGRYARTELNESKFAYIKARKKEASYAESNLIKFCIPIIILLYHLQWFFKLMILKIKKIHRIQRLSELIHPQPEHLKIYYFLSYDGLFRYSIAINPGGLWKDLTSIYLPKTTFFSL